MQIFNKISNFHHTEIINFIDFKDDIYNHN